MDLGAPDFAAFFRGIHGYPPFPWQQHLVDLLVESDTWPDVLDLPTGTGKTAALDAAVFHLALRFERPARAALRIALVVDRRLVVDDAHERAEKIAGALDAPSEIAAAERPIVAEVADRLRHLAGDGEPPLVAQRLRGGAPLEADWARTPTQPTILCSTVDQVGSRLLFRGYGVSDRMKPVHAGLLGNHSLILLDEAHLSVPFQQTLRAVHAAWPTYGPSSTSNSPGTEVGRVQSVLLSATPGSKPKRPVVLKDRDYANPELKRRLGAPKRASLRVVRSNPGDEFVGVARETMERLRGRGVSIPAVGVVVNRVGLAREIFEKLNALANETATDTVLLIGRAREVGRDRIVARLAPFRTGARESSSPRPVGGRTGEVQLPLPHDPTADPQTRPLFVVATQCLEVGVDLDLDGLVTQAASFDALRQRFGRLNRAGRDIDACGVILALAEDVHKNADDAVYGDRIARTWETLQRIARGDEIDFGISALDRDLRELGDVTALSAPPADAPALMPAYLDLWSQTSPPPAADPEVGLFLHGVERTSVGVSLVWRSDIATDALRSAPDWNPAHLLELVPPRAAEMIEVPLWAASAWLRRSRDRDRLSSISDAAERGDDERVQATQAAGGGERLAFRWAGAGDPRTGLVGANGSRSGARAPGGVTAGGLRPGDVIVVPADQGGCDEFGWNPASDTPVSDVADTAAWPFRRRRLAVRIARDVVATDSQWERLQQILEDDSLAGLDLVDALLDALPAESASDSGDGDEGGPYARPVREPLEALGRATGPKPIRAEFPYAGGRKGGVVLVAPYGVPDSPATEARQRDGRPATEDDQISRTARTPVRIDVHTEHVAANVKRFVNVLGYSDRPESTDLRLAAFLHDAGKADPRFQRLLSGGDPWNRPVADALAKSGQPSPKGAWERAGLPRGWRHEALSVRMAQAHPRFSEAHDPALVLWLIGTHHGLGRPFFDFADPRNDGSSGGDLYGCLAVEHWRLASGPGPQSPAFDLNGLDWPAMYEQLKQRYGIWGLAHLEAVLRLADHRASESEQGDD